MIIPSIDLMNGNAVQLVGGEKKEIDAGDPFPLAKKFSLAGEIAVIDLDAALSQGSNEKTIREIVCRYPSRVGGGIRDFDTAVKWLDAGATQIIIGTAASKELLSRLPRERVTVALDAKHGEVVVEGWRKGTGRTLLSRIEELRPYVGGFLITFVEREGRLQGIDMDQVKKVVEAAEGIPVTVAGGVTSLQEIRQIDALGADAQVGMAIYSGKMDLADAIIAPMKSDRPDGLFATVIADEQGNVLGLAYSDKESVREAVRSGRGVYHSRSRGLWIKGDTSGDTQELKKIELDCDRDAMLYIVKQNGRGFCHKGTWRCFGEDRGLAKLLRRLEQRKNSGDEASYTKKLLNNRALLKSKLVEEARFSPLLFAVRSSAACMRACRRSLRESTCPTNRIRTLFRSSSSTSLRSTSKNRPMSRDTSSRGRRQFSLLKAKRVRKSRPASAAFSTIIRTGRTPARCPE